MHALNLMLDYIIPTKINKPRKTPDWNINESWWRQDMACFLLFYLSCFITILPLGVCSSNTVYKVMSYNNKMPVV